MATPKEVNASALVQEALAKKEEAVKAVNNELEAARARVTELENDLEKISPSQNHAVTPEPPARNTSRSTRTRKGGKRADEALKLIQDNPGITVADLAKHMKIAPNYLYRVTNQLVEAKAVKKDGKGLVAA